MPTMLDLMRKIQRGSLPPPSVAELLGLRLVSAEPKPVWTGRLVATGRLVKGGRTVGLTECDVVDDKERLVARASSTLMTLRGETAAGR